MRAIFSIYFTNLHFYAYFCLKSIKHGQVGYHCNQFTTKKKQEQTSGLWEQEIHRHGMFPMTVTHLEPDPPPSDMQWTAQGRPSTQPHVRSAHRTRQGTFRYNASFSSYATTTREITMGWDSPFFQPTQRYHIVVGITLL